MSGHDKSDPGGIRSDDVSYEEAASHLHIYTDGRERLKLFQEPVLLHANNPHERLFVAALDGTGDDEIHDPEHATNVALISDQIKVLNDSGNSRVARGYVPGAGTEQHRPVARLWDDLTGYSVDERAEEMYKQFIDQAKRWRREDPHVQVRLASISFSRGGEEAALLARLVDERGIQDSSGATYTYDSHHQIKHVRYTRPALVGPHHVAQAVVMFDPVGTGHAMHDDRRLPPSVISGIQLIALDERRSLFKSDHIIDPGLTQDGRFAGIYVPGAHSDVGGGYDRDGLSIRSGNLAIDYLNGLSDTPFLQKVAEPDDPRLNVIHHSVEGNLIYRLTPVVDRLQRNGYNEVEVSANQRGQVPDARNAEPRDEALSAQFERQRMPDGPLPASRTPAYSAGISELDAWIDRLHLAAQNPDPHAWDNAHHATAQEFLGSPGGQLFQQQASDINRNWSIQRQAQQPQQQQAVRQGM